MRSKIKISIIGLGYVGLPLAHALSMRFDVVGYDISRQRIVDLQAGLDRAGALTETEKANSFRAKFTDIEADIYGSDIFIVTVPTPIDSASQPDLGPLRSACQTVARAIRAGGCVVFESTVYPGLTEEFCVPIIEENSGLIWLRDFNVGYSPERINPGDETHDLSKIVKVVAGDTPDTLDLLAEVYGAVITAGIHRAESIKVAEAAKVIENTQRDLNIALINELSIIFNLAGISTASVLAAARTKWNFNYYTPGLVGGHCIGIDPYYLTYKAQQLGYVPQVILAGRKINEEMVSYVATNVVKGLCRLGPKSRPWKVLVLGVTFKENCTDLRNSKILALGELLQEFGLDVQYHDPHARIEYPLEFEISATESIDDLDPCDAILLGSPHRWYSESLFLEKLLETKLHRPGILFDLKASYIGLLPDDVTRWSL